MAGDGLVRPLNAPTGQPLAYGTQPGTTSPLLRAVLVLVGGGGVSGVFVYDPAIAAGDLIASMTDATADPFGDVTAKGVTAYVVIGGHRYAINLNQQIALGLPGLGVFNTASQPFSASGFYAFSNGTALAEALIYSGQVTNTDVAAYLTVESQTQSTVTNGAMAVNAGNITLGSHLTLVVNDNTQAVTATGGSVSTPTLITTDAWNQISPLTGTWTNSGSGVNGFFYRLQTDNTVALAWDVSNNNANPGTLGTLPAAYRPATTVRLASGWTGTGPTSYNDQFAPAIEVHTDGTIHGDGLFVATLTLFGTAVLPLGSL